MFWFKGAPPKTLDNNLRTLVKSFNNLKIKSLIKSSQPSDLIDGTGTTIFHLAAKYSNLGLISILLSSGYCVNVRDAHGTSPLLMASLSRNFAVVKVLLDANADVFAGNLVGQTPLSLLLDKKNDVPVSVSRRLASNLRRSRVDDEQLARLLLEAGSGMEFALMLENAGVTRIMLRQTEEISMDRAHDLLLAAMRANYLENINVLLHNGHKAGYRREKFLENIVDRLRTGAPPDLEYLRPYIQNLAELNVVDKSFVSETLIPILLTAKKPVLELLLKYGVDEWVKSKFRRDLKIYLFGNTNIDPLDVLSNSEFKVNERDQDGETALHVATRRSLSGNVQLLIDLGASPHLKDKNGRTALFYAWDEDIADLLLLAGSDVQILDKQKLSIFDRTNQLTKAMQAMLARLAILEKRGMGIKGRLVDRISSRKNFEKYYIECKKQIDWLQEKIVRDGNITLRMYWALCETPLELMDRVNNREIIVKALYDIHSQVIYENLKKFFRSSLISNLNGVLSIIDR